MATALKDREEVAVMATALKAREEATVQEDLRPGILEVCNH
jgi:hypothetical protein